MELERAGPFALWLGWGLRAWGLTTAGAEPLRRGGDASSPVVPLLPGGCLHEVLLRRVRLESQHQLKCTASTQNETHTNIHTDGKKRELVTLPCMIYILLSTANYSPFIELRTGIFSVYSLSSHFENRLWTHPWVWLSLTSVHACSTLPHISPDVQ